MGTIPPIEINRMALKYYLKYPWRRFIIHYLQPHAPYLSPKFNVKGYYKPNLKEGSILSGIQGYKKINKRIENMLNILGIFLSKMGVVESAWELREKVELPPISSMDAVRRKYGKKG